MQHPGNDSGEHPTGSVVQISIQHGIAVRSDSGEDLRPTARKAQALLAILSLSGGVPVSRQRLASLLWSLNDPSTSLARLRNTIFELRSNMAAYGIDVLSFDNRGISLRQDRVLIKVGDDGQHSTAIGEFSRDFLVELEGVDPSFDRWLASLRRGSQRSSVLTDSPERRTAARDPGPGLRALAITEFSAHGSDEARTVAQTISYEVRSALSKVRWFRTVTRDPRGQQLKFSSEDLAELADYALMGTVSAHGGRQQVYVEASALGQRGTLEWAGRYELRQNATAEDLRDVAERVSARVDIELLLAETGRARQDVLSTNTDTYELVLRAVPAIFRLEQEEFLGAGHLLEQAVEAFPQSAFAQSWFAYWSIFLVGQGWTNHAAHIMTKAEAAINRAILLDPKDASAFAIAGHLKAFVGKRLDDAEALHSVALQLNPCLPLAWHLAAMTSAYAGRLDEACTRLARCRNLSEGNPMGFFSEAAESIILLLKGEHEEAAEVGRRVIQRQPNFTSAYKSTISALGHMGQMSEAGRLIQKLKLLEPQFTLRKFQTTAPFRNRRDLGHYVAGLKLAGLT